MYLVHLLFQVCPRLSYYFSEEYKSLDLERKKQKIGDFIYRLVVRITGENLAPKVTGMIIDLSEEDIIYDACSTIDELKLIWMQGMELLSNNNS